MSAAAAGAAMSERDDLPFCSVCHEVPRVPSTLSSCAHVYCRACIVEWSKQQNVCPLCGAIFVSITSASGDGGPPIVLQVKEPTKGPDQGPVTSEALMGLDHEYFINECSKLGNAIASLRPATRGHNRSVWDCEVAEALGEASRTLDSILDGLLDGEFFDAVSTLQALYGVEETLSWVRAGPSLTVSTRERAVVGASDVDNLDSFQDGDYFDDEDDDDLRGDFHDDRHEYYSAQW